MGPQSEVGRVQRDVGLEPKRRLTLDNAKRPLSAISGSLDAQFTATGTNADAKVDVFDCNERFYQMLSVGI
jgi:hypothetical protein